MDGPTSKLPSNTSSAISSGFLKWQVVFLPGGIWGHLGHNLQGFGGLVTHLHAAYVLSILPSIISHFCHALITFKK